MIQDQPQEVAITILDDNQIELELIQIALKRISKELNQDFKASYFTEIDAFYDECKRSQPELIITDLNIRNTNTIELVGKIRKNQVLKNTPILMLSNSLNEEEILKSYQAGISFFSKKESSFTKFVATIRKAIKLYILDIDENIEASSASASVKFEPALSQI